MLIKILFFSSLVVLGGCATQYYSHHIDPSTKTITSQATMSLTNNEACRIATDYARTQFNGSLKCSDVSVEDQLPYSADFQRENGKIVKVHTIDMTSCIDYTANQTMITKCHKKKQQLLLI